MLRSKLQLILFFVLAITSLNLLASSYQDTTPVIICPGDYDCDGIPDQDDLDDDNDGILDTDEGLAEVKKEYELSATFKKWVLEGAKPSTTKYFSKAKYSFSDGSYMTVETDDTKWNSTFSIPAKTNKKAYSLSSTYVRANTWTKDKPAVLKFSETTVPKSANIDDYAALHINTNLGEIEKTKKEVNYTIKFFNKDNTPKKVYNPVVHLDRIGTLKNKGGKLIPCSVKLTLKDYTWNRPQFTLGTKDFKVEDNSVYDSSTIAYVDSSDPLQNDTADTELSYMEAHPNKRGASAGSLVIEGIMSEFTLVASVHGSATEGVIDAFKMMVHINKYDQLENSLDTDKDGIPDYHDLDSDGDTCSDASEGSANISSDNLVTVTKGKLFLDNKKSLLKNLGLNVGSANSNSQGLPNIAGSGQKVGDARKKKVGGFKDLTLTEIKGGEIKEGEDGSFKCTVSGGKDKVLISYLWKYSVDGSEWFDLSELTGVVVDGDKKGDVKSGGTVELKLKKVTNSINNLHLKVLFAQNYDCGREKSAKTIIKVKKNIINCPNDYDCDGVIDRNDLDDDNDGILDYVECGGGVNSKKSYITGGDKANPWKRSKLSGKEYIYEILIEDVIVRIKHNNTEEVGQNNIAWKHIKGVWTESGKDRDLKSINPLNLSLQGKSKLRIQFLDKQTKTEVEVEDVYMHFNGLGTQHKGNYASAQLSFIQSGNAWVKESGTKDFEFKEKNNLLRDRFLDLGKTPTDETTMDELGAAGGSMKLKNKTNQFSLDVSQSNLYAKADIIQLIISFKKQIDNTGSCTKDSDNDGILDYQDLDSDNDGCPDAFEGGSNDEQDRVKLSMLKQAEGILFSKNKGIAGASLLNLGSDVNKANGIPIVITEPNGQTIGSSIEIGSISTVTTDTADKIGAIGSEISFISSVDLGKTKKEMIVFDWEYSDDKGVTWMKSSTFKDGAQSIKDETKDGKYITTLTIKDIKSELENAYVRFVYKHKNNACFELSDKVKVVLKLKPEFDQVGPICTPDDFSLKTTSKNGIKGGWSPVKDINKTVIYTFTPDPGQNAAPVKMEVIVNKKGLIKFKIPTNLCPEDTYELPKKDINDIRGTWDKPLDRTKTDTYLFTPDDTDCNQPLSVTINPQVCGGKGSSFNKGKELVCNVISLKSDNYNDYLRIKGIENYPDNTIQIYNRWGSLVYEKEGYTKDTKWSGYSNSSFAIGSSTLATGTYYYIFIYKDKSQKTKTEKGWIYIKSIN